MAELLPIPVSDLLIDAENPRLKQPNVGQRDAQRELAAHLQSKLLKLAKDIVEYGMNPSDLPLVMPNKGDSRFIVLEGNRRLVAIKSLENPDSIAGAITPAILTALRRLSTQYQQSPLESINCVVVKDREKARHWIELRHTGENEGAGIVRWGSEESARFRARNGVVEPHLQALDFLEQRGALTPAQRHKVPKTNLKRLLNTPEVREKFGVDIRDRNLEILGKEEQVAKDLQWLVNKLSDGSTKVEDIYTKGKRLEFANKIPASLVVKSSPTGGNGAGQKPKTKRAASTKLPKQRNKLIPRDCILTINPPRIARIEQELRVLNFEDYTNAAAVLYRVFVELSVDSYMDTHKLPVTERTPLTTKLMDVANHLVSRKKLTKPLCTESA